MQNRVPIDKRPSGLAQAAPRDTRRVTSSELLGARGEIVIEHQGRDYRLRITQNGRLILTA
ncbi:MAG: hemin uptake protein HemP [Burkholderiales bacterium]